MTVPTPPTDYHYHQGEALQHLRTANPTNDAEHLAAANTHAALALAAAVHAWHEDWNRPVDVVLAEAPPTGPHSIVGTGWSAALPDPGLFVVCACSQDDTGYGDGTPIPIESFVSKHLGVSDAPPAVAAAEPLAEWERELLRAQGEALRQSAACPDCGSPNPFEVRPPCSLDRYDPHPWHRDSLHRSSRGAAAAAYIARVDALAGLHPSARINGIDYVRVVDVVGILGECRHEDLACPRGTCDLTGRDGRDG